MRSPPSPPPSSFTELPELEGVAGRHRAAPVQGLGGRLKVAVASRGRVLLVVVVAVVLAVVDVAAAAHLVLLLLLVHLEGGGRARAGGDLRRQRAHAGSRRPPEGGKAVRASLLSLIQRPFRSVHLKLPPPPPPQMKDKCTRVMMELCLGTSPT